MRPIMETVPYWGLFISAFISSTIAPGGSEILLVYMVLDKTAHIPVLLSVATLGNTLGAFTTWGLGYLAARKYPLESILSPSKQQAITWVTTWGYWALLFSWLPVVGDGFCFAGGWLKMPFFPSAITICLGKAVRYCVVVYLALLG